jgi:hypothetical protein
MAGERTIKIKVDGDGRGLVQLSQQGKKSMGDLDNSFKGMSTGAKLALASLGVAFGAWVKATADSLVNIQRLNAQTDTVIKSMGAAWTDTDHITGYANKLEKLSGVEAEQVQAGQNLLLTYGNIQNRLGAGNDVFDQATSLMLDLSVATGKDMPSAANLLGKALNDPIAGLGALTKVGVQFTAAQKEQIQAFVESGDVMSAQKIILAELTRQFGGSAKAFGETTAGQVLKLQNQFGDLSEELLTGIMPTLNSLLSIAADVIGWLQDNAGLVKVLAVALGGLAGTWVLVEGAIKLVNATTTAWNAVSKLAMGSTAGLGASFAAMGTAAKIASLSMGAIGIIATIIGTALSLFSGQSQEAEAQQSALAAASKDVAKVLAEENNQLNKKTRASAAAALEAGGLLKTTKDLGVSTRDLADAYLGDNDARIRLNKSIQDHIDQLNKEEDAALAAGDANRGADIETEIEGYRDLKTAVDNAIGGRQQESEAIDRQQEATEGNTGATKDATGALQAQVDALYELIDAQREAAGEILSQRDAERNLLDSVAAADEAFKQNGATLDINTQKGRDNQEALDNIASSTFDVIDAMVKNNATQAQLDDAMTRGRAAFIATAQQMGLNETQARQLANQLNLIPTSISTQVLLDISNVYSQAQKAASVIANLPRTLLFGQRATGGPLQAGRSYLVGERGPEIMTMPNSIGGRMFSNAQSADMLGGGDTVVYVTIDGQQLQGRIDRTVRENNRSLKRAASSGTGATR